MATFGAPRLAATHPVETSTAPIYALAVARGIRTATHAAGDHPVAAPVAGSRSRARKPNVPGWAARNVPRSTVRPVRQSTQSAPGRRTWTSNTTPGGRGRVAHPITTGAPTDGSADS